MNKNRIMLILVMASLLLNILALEPYQNLALANPLSQDDSEDLDIPCYSLTIVFLVDKSISMQDNDPKNLRKEAFDWVISWLGDNILYQCPDGAHTVGVIGFAGHAWVDLELTTINPQDHDSWVDIVRPAIQNKVKDTLVGGTQPIHAFVEAASMFESASLQSSYPQKRLIILLTDGDPAGVESGTEYARKYGELLYSKVKNLFPFNPTLLKQEKCLDDARQDGDVTAEEKYFCLKTFSVPSQDLLESTYIWAILLNQGRPYYAGFKSWLDQITAEHAGETFSLIRNSDIPIRFLEILTQMVGVKAEPLNCGLFPMEPYLEQSTLQFFKIEPSITVNISYERDGKTFTINQDLLAGQTKPYNIEGFNIKDYTQDATIERYVFYHPTGGQWRITSSDCQGIQGFFESLDLSSNLAQVINRQIPQMDLPPYFDADNPVLIDFFLLDRVNQGGKVPEDPMFPINIDLLFTKPDGNTEDVKVLFDPSLNVFRNLQPLNVSQSGDYSFTILATTPYADSKKQQSAGSRILLKEGPISFTVSPAAPFQYPMSLSQSVIPQVDIEPYYEPEYPVFVQYQLIDSLSRRHTAGEDPNYPINIEVQITRPDGSTQNMGMVYDSRQKLFQSTEPINLSVDGIYTVTAKAVINTVLNGQVSSSKSLFNDGPNEFTVNPVIPFVLSIKGPTEGQQVTMHSGPTNRLRLNQARLVVELTDRDGALLDPNDVFVDPDNSLTAVYEADGQSKPVFLVHSLDQPGLFTGAETVFEYQGNQKFTFSIVGPYNRDKYRPDPFSNSVTFTVGDNLFTNPATYRLLAVLAVFLLIAFAVWVFLNRKNPVTGTITIEAGGVDIAIFELGSGWNTTKIGRKILKANPGLDMRSFKARNSRSVDNAVEFEAVAGDGSRTGGDLPANAPMDLYGGMSIIYEPLDKYQSYPDPSYLSGTNYDQP
jgi:hypothetical protein